MKFSWKRLNRRFHYWGAFLSALPVLIIICTGILLLLKKEFAWIQPPTISGSSETPSISFEEILAATKTAPEAKEVDWSSIDRLDVNPRKGVVKVRTKNRWEIQLDLATAEVLQVAYRRSDLIESMHDGTFFHDRAKLWVFLPSAAILLILWCTGIILFFQPFSAKRRRKKKAEAISRPS
ncbi:MAG: PepSY-associated TM helix domain-containing protein [Verrucomicrobiota bacterium]